MTPLSFRVARSWTGIAALASGLALAGAVTQAQTAPMLVLMDQNAIAANQAPNMFAASDINQTIAGAGVRDELPAFVRLRGQVLTLPGGVTAHEGWFAPTAMPSNWASTSGANDATRNFLLAGAGLGSPDATGNRTSLLGSVAGLKPLHVTQMQSLVGVSVCAVVFAGEIPWNQNGTSLKGGTLGILAFSIVSVSATSGGAFSIRAKVIDADSTCAGSLALASL